MVIMDYCVESDILHQKKLQKFLRLFYWKLCNKRSCPLTGSFSGDKFNPLNKFTSLLLPS